jgi:hypothetical protein
MAWANFAGYQLVWFAAVIGAGHGLAWPGMLAAAVFVALQWTCSAHRGADARLVGIAMVLGLSIDGALAVGGRLAYAAAVPTIGWAPAWIVALWAAFAMTLNHSLTLLQGRPWLAAALGASGGPLAYWGAARGWQAVTFVPPAWQGLLALALAWGLAIPLLAALATRLRRADAAPAPAAALPR